MTEFTTTSLIEFLLKFPKDLPIETELACMWNYPEEILEKMLEVVISEQVYDEISKIINK